MFAALYSPGLSSPAPLVECAADFSPRIEITAADTVTLDISGLAHLFGSIDNIAQALARRAAEAMCGPEPDPAAPAPGERGAHSSREAAPGAAARTGVSAPQKPLSVPDRTGSSDIRVAVASNPDAAVHAARGIAGVTVIAPGDEARTLGPLPIAVLDPSEQLAETLARWGIRTLEELAALPEAGVTERLGPEGALLHKLARGAGDRPLVPPQSATVFEDALDLEHPITLLEPLAFLLSRMLNALCAKLGSHGLAAHEVRLTLKLENAPPHERVLRLPYPMRDAKAFLKLITLDLEMHPPAGPILALALAMEPVNPRVVQHGLFVPLAPEPQKLELTLARIAKIAGEGNAGAAEIPDTHRPGAFRMKRFAPPPADARPKHAPPANPRAAARVFRPALRAAIDAPGGRPSRIQARGIRGVVVASAGPWRTSGDWWREDAWSRDEWDIALGNGALYRIYRDRASGEWFIEAAYD
ncbi:MAG: hypothetical protein ACM3ZB_06540 [bacterium]